jgi:hypothetical protein
MSTQQVAQAQSFTPRSQAGTFNIKYKVAAYVLALPGDTYHKIAVRQLLLTNPHPTLAEKVAERKRIRKLNNGAPVVAGQKVRIK